MKKPPIDTHPADQYMQSLDAKIQPVINEVHWDGMQALLDENFPSDEEPGAGVPQSDSKPVTGAGKAVKGFRWLFLGGIALIATLAGTQWDVFAFQNTEIRQEQSYPELEKGLEERTKSSFENSAFKKTESKTESNQFDNSGNEIISNPAPVSEELNPNMSESNSSPEKEMQNLSEEKLIEGDKITGDSIPAKKQMEAERDTASVKKKKFIFW